MTIPTSVRKWDSSVAGKYVRRLLPAFIVGFFFGLSVLPAADFLKSGGRHWDGYDSLLRKDYLGLARYLREGGDPDARYQDGVTLLQKASTMGDETSVYMLISSGAEVDVQSKFGYTALANALGGLVGLYHHIELGDLGMNQNIRNNISERIKVIDVLLDMGADINGEYVIPDQGEAFVIKHDLGRIPFGERCQVVSLFARRARGDHYIDQLYSECVNK